MQILTAAQIREADRITIEKEPVSSLNLMERAASKCFDWFNTNISKETPIVIICGRGNNGGDGLALSRMLYSAGFETKTIVLQFDSTLSDDCKTNLERLQKIDSRLVEVVINNFNFPKLKPETLLVDAIFGTGLSRNLDGVFGEVVKKMNESGRPMISIDLPSGIRSDESSLIANNEIIKAKITLTFQYPKMALLVGENAPFYGKVVILDIGLLPDAIPASEVKDQLVDESDIQQIFKPKWEFSHKGNFGHALLITGEKGKMGAAILAAGGFLRSGGGLLTLLVPDEGINIVQTAVPEAMVWIRDENASASFLPDLEKYTVVGMGPGTGMSTSTTQLLKKLIESSKRPLVLDADALNILAAHPEWISSLPPDSILTPHPGEFKRLAGEWKNDFEKLKMQREFAQKNKIYLVLKGKNTSVACPDGKMFFNPTGNAGMAKGGSGDVLTGLLTGILASGYSPEETCILGTYLHGLAGDLAATKLTKEAMKAGDLIDFLPTAWKKIIG